MSLLKRLNLAQFGGQFGQIMKFGGWLPVVALLAAVVALGVSFGMMAKARAYEREGVVAAAQITSTRTDVRRDSDGNRTYTHFATFTFRAGSEDILREVSVSEGFQRGHPEGTSTEIRYLASKPTRFEYEIGSSRRNGQRGYVIAGGLVLLAMGSALWVGRKYRRATNVLKNGQRITAEVTKVAAKMMRVNEQVYGVLHWVEPDGQTGKSQRHPLFELQGRFQAGDEITVLRHGKTAWWDGDLEQRDEGLNLLQPNR